MGSIISNRQNNDKDIFKLAREAITPGLIQSYIPGLTLSGDGRELTGCAPCRDDKHPSFSINTGTGAWFDHATGDGGSFTDLVARIKGLEPLEAAKLIAGEPPSPQNRVSFTRPKRPNGIDACKADLPFLQAWLSKPGYRDNLGTLQALYTYPLDIPPWPFVVARFARDGGKLIMPYYLTKTKEGWKSGYPPQYGDGGRPLYRRGGSGSLWAGKVFIVEGEKCADAIASMSGAVAVTWAGGCNAADKSDWTLFQDGNFQDGNSRIILWPDNDEPGLKAMKKIAGILRDLGVKIEKLMDINPAKPKGWDVADGREEGEDLEKYVETFRGISDMELIAEEKQETKNTAFPIPEIVEKYGEPMRLGEGRIKNFNQHYWGMAAMYDKIQVYEPNERVIYRYDTERGLYSPVYDEALQQEIAEYMLIISRKEKIAALTNRSHEKLNNCLKQVKGLTSRPGIFETGREKEYLHFENEMLELETMKLKPFSPDYYSRNQCPFKYEPGAQCPKFNEFINSAMSPDDALIVQKYMGVCLLGVNLPQRFLILTGGAGKGKSQLSNIFQMLIGKDNCCQLRTEHLAGRFELYRFVGKTLLIGVDVPENFLSSKGANVIKALTGGDTLTPEKKGSSKSWEITGNFPLIITANTRLRIRLEGDIGAWRRRLLIVEYNKPEAEHKIYDISRRLMEEEGSGIVNFAVEGLLMVREDMKQYNTIDTPREQNERINSLLAESESLKIFLEECIQPDTDGGDLAVAEIEAAYAEYCSEKGWKANSLTEIRSKLEGFMLEIHRRPRNHCTIRDGKNVRGFAGVAFK